VVYSPVFQPNNFFASFKDNLGVQRIVKFDVSQVNIPTVVNVYSYSETSFTNPFSLLAV